ncbi:LANO_0B01838g1_1 [Lachancea nothofagi CBS 11611]|uniref:LANO_0B01838g1_1 n=1 Tax=Lachancea nothofagi CBS 11611 TaxID=1266666 RepID=A0A1G4IVY1_9SACH|nr:LANO_0B01838g1_1 [Lachancea nothofagi CBS 11611]
MSRVRRLSDNKYDPRTLKKSRTPAKQLPFYLESIDIKKLDFDREQICSVTLSPLNVYCCLTCGKFLQGRGEKSVAFLHSIHEDHHVFMNLKTRRAYILPENYEIPAIQFLEKIKFAICPSYTQKDIASYPVKCFDMSNNPYLNGLVGLDDPNHTLHVTVILQLVAQISPLRDILLLMDSEDFKDELLKRLSVLVKKIWSPYLFRSHLSPHEFLHQLTLVKTTTAEETDPKSFLLWLINYICTSNPELKKVLTQNMRGEIIAKTTTVKEVSMKGEGSLTFVKDESSSSLRKRKFWILSLDLPPMPLFKDGFDTNSIPQVKMETLMNKFNGTQVVHTNDGTTSYETSRLPKFLILHIDRFNRKDEYPIKNRNQTLVKFPDTLVLKGRAYQLITSIAHNAIKGNYSDEAEVDQESEWKLQVLERKGGRWFEINGKSVTPKEKELLFLDESYLQVWEALE